MTRWIPSDFTDLSDSIASAATISIFIVFGLVLATALASAGVTAPGGLNAISSVPDSTTLGSSGSGGSGWVSSGGSVGGNSNPDAGGSAEDASADSVRTARGTAPRRPSRPSSTRFRPTTVGWR